MDIFSVLKINRFAENVRDVYLHRDLHSDAEAERANAVKRRDVENNVFKDDGSSFSKEINKIDKSLIDVKKLSDIITEINRNPEILKGNYGFCKLISI